MNIIIIFSSSPDFLFFFYSTPYAQPSISSFFFTISFHFFTLSATPIPEALLFAANPLLYHIFYHQTRPWLLEWISIGFHTDLGQIHDRRRCLFARFHILRRHFSTDQNGNRNRKTSIAIAVILGRSSEQLIRIESGMVSEASASLSLSLSLPFKSTPVFELDFGLYFDHQIDLPISKHQKNNTQFSNDHHKRFGHLAFLVKTNLAISKHLKKWSRRKKRKKQSGEEGKKENLFCEEGRPFEVEEGRKKRENGGGRRNLCFFF